MLAAASLFFTPSTTQAQNITKTNPSKAGTITVDGKVTNITPDRTVNGGKTAINQFAKFELDSGNIANLHLQKANTLVNFVDSKASINGIVNAVKDNKIGGNLYFLSPNGIAVGSSGVINAGQVGLIVPTKNSYKEMLKMDNLSDSTFSQENLNQIPLNYDGSIAIEGSINAPSGITLAAQDIKIESGAKLLNTSKIDFSNLVNVVDSSGEEVSAGLDSDLVLKADNNGGVYITARVDDTTIEENTSSSAILNFSETFTASINVGKGAEIISDSDVTLSSTVNANCNTEATSSLYFNSKLDVAGSIKAKNINLESTAGVDLSSLIKLDFDQSNNTAASLALNLALGQNQSQLTISKSADINAGGKLDISSLAKSPVNMETNVQREGNALGALALTYYQITSSSLLNSEVTLTAKGDINISSKYSAPTFKVKNEISVRNPVSGMEQTEEEAEKTKEAGGAISELINGSGGSSSSSGSDEEETQQDSTTTNGTVVIANNTASLDLGKATSEGNINIEAADVIDDPQIGAISVVPVQEEGGSITPVVAFSMINNNSLIKVSDDRIPTRQKH